MSITPIPPFMQTTPGRPAAGGLLLDALRSVDFLAGGSPALALRFASLGRSTGLPRGHVIWKAGRAAQGIVVPVSGELAAVKADSGGRELCYDFVGPGECAGVSSALDGLPHAEEARATRAGDFFTMERPAFMQFLGEHPHVGANVVAAVCRMVRRNLLERDRMAFLSVDVRLARFLIERSCARQGDGARVLLRATHSEIASRLGSVREVVARARAKLIALGLVKRTRHGVFVADWAGLRRQAGLEAASDGNPPDTDAASPTRRFFLPVLDGHPGAESGGAAETRVCAEHVTDFGPCAARACPLALAALRGSAGEGGGTASASHRAPLMRSSSARLSSAPAAAQHASQVGPSPAEGGDENRERARAEDSASIHAAAPTDRPPPAADDAPRERRRRADRAGRRLTASAATVRNPHEERVIARSIDVYRDRVDMIESRFGGDHHVPRTVTLFRDAAAGMPLGRASGS